MEVREAIAARRSARSYTDRALTKAEVTELLNAGILAPSACNMQSWHFYVVSGADRRRFSGVCADWIQKAPVVIIVCTDGDAIESRFGERAKKFPVQDTALAIENILLRATELGLGGCIIGAYNDAACRAAFPEIGAAHRIVALLPIGEPAELPAPRGRKPFSEAVTFLSELPD